MIGSVALGRCLNRGRCGLADAGTAIPVTGDAPFVCPECGSKLLPHEGVPKRVKPDQPKRKFPWLIVIPAVILVLAIGIGLVFDLFGTIEMDDVPPVAGGGEMTLGTPDDRVKIGTTPATWERLAPGLARAFMRYDDCRDAAETRRPASLSIACNSTSRPPLTLVVAAPDSVLNTAGTAANALDVLITTNAVLPAPPPLPGGEPAAPVPSAPPRTIAIDAIAIIVHPSNPLARLAPEDLQSIFLGTVTDFARVGGAPGQIRVVAPAGDALAGERLAAIVPKWLPIALTATRLATSADIARVVQDDPAAIGLVDAAAAGRAKVLMIGPRGGVATAPTPMALISGDYPLARPVLAVRYKGDVPPAKAALIDFAGSAQARDVITAAGFEPVRVLREPSTAPASAPPAFQALVAGAERIAADLRFLPGSLELSPRALADLDAVAARLIGERVAGGRLVVIGLSDPAAAPAGSDAARDAAALAQRIATALGERRLTPGQVQAFGAALPVATDTSPGGRARNRRVELWLRPA